MEGFYFYMNKIGSTWVVEEPKEGVTFVNGEKLDVPYLTINKLLMKAFEEGKKSAQFS